MIIELILYISITSFIISSAIGLSFYSQKNLDDLKNKIEETISNDKGFISSSFIFLTFGLVFIYISFISEKALDLEGFVYSKEKKVQFEFNKDFNNFLYGIYHD